LRDIAQNTVIQIEITNACHLKCTHCTRHVGHHRKPFFMDTAFVRRAIASLDGWEGRIGIMGGEPCLHPDFEEICAIVEEMVPHDRREFWTAGFKWGEYESLIKRVFPRINYNDHVAYDGAHTPLLVALEEVVDDPELRAELIENCPFQSHWSASVTPKGAWFCEIAASMDWLFDGPGGWPIEPGWWKRTVKDYKDQIDWACNKCSGAIPMPAFSDGRGGRDGPTIDHISPGNVERLKACGSQKVAKGHYTVWTDKITREHVEAHKARNPRAYRTFEAFKPEDVQKALAEGRGCSAQVSL
jgi:hypothetical protein